MATAPNIQNNPRVGLDPKGTSPMKAIDIIRKTNCIYRYITHAPISIGIMTVQNIDRRFDIQYIVFITITLDTTKPRSGFFPRDFSLAV